MPKVSKTIRLNIQAECDRTMVVTGLANSGYKVWVTEVDKNFETTYYVCFERKRNK